MHASPTNLQLFILREQLHEMLHLLDWLLPRRVESQLPHSDDNPQLQRLRFQLRQVPPLQHDIHHLSERPRMFLR